MTVVKRIQRAFARICGPSSCPHVTDGRQPSENQIDDIPRDENAVEVGTPAVSRNHELCPACSQIDIRSMLQSEKVEQDIGPISDRLSPDCPFCNLISEAVRRKWDDYWSSSKLRSESDRVPKLYVQSRSPFSVKENGYVEHPQPRLLIAVDVKPPGYQENRKAIREVDRVKNRFIIAEIEVLYDGSRGQILPLVPRRQAGPSIDYEIVKSWLRQCKGHKHSSRNQEAIELSSNRNGFRLIDVEKMCLVLVTEPCDFAALSYVWGRLPTLLHPGIGSERPVLLTTEENVERLSTPKGLSSSAIVEMNARIPQTVRDAMTFCRNIGMKHLWIDTLCIIQNDREDKSYLIERMDDVYDHATVTLIAASGENADSGLKGVSARNIRRKSTCAILDEGSIINLSLCPPSLSEEIRTSVWNTRGWTFQEQALSQRCLYFTPEELFFNCRELQWREAYNLEDVNPRIGLSVRTGPPWWSRNLRKDPDPTPYQYLGGGLNIYQYQSAVQSYSRRTLSFPEDILHAFEGIFNRFNETGSGELNLEQTQGIPSHLMHQALLWFPSDEARKRVCPGVDVQFSTWSWASWDGPIEFVFADSTWLSRNISQAPIKKIPMHSLIPCWFHSSTSQRFWSQDIWQAAGQMDGMASDYLTTLSTYVTTHIGIDTDHLLSKATTNTPTLSAGELGFTAAYIDANDVSMSVKKGSHIIHTFEIGPHKGEFRLDDEAGEVDEFLAVVASDTITKTPDRMTIFLGVKTEEGISRRVGLGWVYYSKTEIHKPSWKYRFFQVK